MLTRTEGVTAVVPAGGLGRRMQTDVPKQFIDIGGKPVFIRTLDKLDQCRDIRSIIVVIPSAYIVLSQQLIETHHIRKVIQIVAGGMERQDSVWNGLQVLPAKTNLVLVHDAVRPFVSVQKISESIRAARKYGAAILAVSSRNTIKQVDDGWVVRTLERNKLWQVQTPQVFKKAWILDAYEKAKKDGICSTDDSMLVERLGKKVKVVVGEETNIKMTTQEDLAMARVLLDDEPS